MEKSKQDSLFLKGTLVLTLWKYHERIQEFSPMGREGGSDDVFLGISLFYSFTEGFQWFIFKEN